MRIKQEYGNKEYDSRSLIFLKAPKTKYAEKQNSLNHAKLQKVV